MCPKLHQTTADSTGQSDDKTHFLCDSSVVMTSTRSLIGHWARKSRKYALRLILKHSSDCMVDKKKRLLARLQKANVSFRKKLLKLMPLDKLTLIS